MRKTIWIVSGVCVAIGIGRSSAQEAGGVEDMQKGLAAMMQAVTAGATNTAGVVDFKQLKVLLPAAWTGFKRTSAKGERTGAFGMTVAQATAEYANEAGGTVNVQIQDLGGTGMAGMAAAGWQAADVDSESDDGYEKTSVYKGVKIHEEYKNSGKTGTLQTMVGKRFMVSIRISDLDATVMQAVLGKIDLTKLANLKPVEPAQQ